MMKSNHFYRAALHQSGKCRTVTRQCNTDVKGDGNQKRLISTAEEASDHQRGFRQPESPGPGVSSQCAGTRRRRCSDLEAFPAQLASVRDKGGCGAEVFLAPAALLSSRETSF